MPVKNDKKTAGVRSAVVVRWMASATALVVLLAGCIGQTRRNSALGHLEPCDLLDAAGRSALAVTEGRPANMGATRACTWQHEGAEPNETFRFRVVLNDANNYFDRSTPNAQPLPSIGSHQAVRYIDPDGACQIQIGAGHGGRWLVECGVGGGDPRERCRLADQLAALIEPKLP